MQERKTNHIFVVLNMWAYGDWSHTTPKKWLDQTAQENVHKG